MFTAAQLAKIFNKVISATKDVGAITESEADSGAFVAKLAGEAILKTKGDKATEVHEAVDGWIVAGAHNAVFLGNDGANKLAQPKQTGSPATPANEDANTTMIGSWQGKGCDDDTFKKTTKGLEPEVGQEGTLNFIKYSDAKGNMVGAAVKGTDGKKSYFITMPAGSTTEDVSQVINPAVAKGVKQALSFLRAGKTDLAMEHLARADTHLRYAKTPSKLKEGKGIVANLMEAAECAVEDPAEAQALLTEAYMAIAAEQGMYDSDAPFSIWSNSVNFRPDVFISKTPDYSVANYILGLAVKEVMKGDLGKKVVAAIREHLAASPKVKALDIELREAGKNESAEGGNNLHEDDANVYDPAALRERIKVLHDYVNQTLTDKLGEDDDASQFLGSASNSQYKDYTDCRFQLGQKLVRSDDGTPGKWVSDPGHSQGAGTGTGDVNEAHQPAYKGLSSGTKVAWTAPDGHSSKGEVVNDVGPIKVGPGKKTAHHVKVKPTNYGKGEHILVPHHKLTVEAIAEGEDHVINSEHTGIFAHAKEHGAMAIPQSGSRGKTEYLIAKKDHEADFHKTYGAALEKSHPGKFTVHPHAYGAVARPKGKGKKVVAEGTDEAKAGIFPGEGNGTVSPYASRNDDGDEAQDGDGHDPDETVAVIVKAEGKLELRAGYDGDGALLASEDCKVEDDPEVKTAQGRLASKAQSMGYVYVPRNMKEDIYMAAEQVLAPNLTAAHLVICAEHVGAFEKAVSDDVPDVVLSSMTKIAEMANIPVPPGLLEGLTARAHKRGRRPLLKGHYEFKSAKKPKGKTGPGASGTVAAAPAGKKGINVGESAETYAPTAGNARPGANGGKVSSDGNAGTTFAPPSGSLKQTGPGAHGEIVAPPDGENGIKVASHDPKAGAKGSVPESITIGEGDDQQQAQAGAFVSYNGDPYVLKGSDKGGQGLIAPIKRDREGNWAEVGAAVKAAPSELNFLKESVHSCPECKGVTLEAIGPALKCEGCNYRAAKDKFPIIEIDSNQKGATDFNTGSIKKPKTGGPQNLIPKGNTPPNDKQEGTANDQQNLMCACPNCENTQDVNVAGKKITCGNCGYEGTAADFQLPSTVGDTVEAWITAAKECTVEEFTESLGVEALTDTKSMFKIKMNKLVEAVKNAKMGEKKSMARKLHNANPIAKRKIGKGINTESILGEGATGGGAGPIPAAPGANVEVTMPRARFDEFLQHAQKAGSDGTGGVDVEEHTIRATVPKAVAEEVKKHFKHIDVSYEDLVPA